MVDSSYCSGNIGKKLVRQKLVQLQAQEEIEIPEEAANFQTTQIMATVIQLIITTVSEFMLPIVCFIVCIALACLILEKVFNA